MHPAEPIVIRSDPSFLGLDFDQIPLLFSVAVLFSQASDHCTIRRRTDSFCLDIFTLVFGTRFSSETCLVPRPSHAKTPKPMHQPAP